MGHNCGIISEDEAAVLREHLITLKASLILLRCRSSMRGSRTYLREHTAEAERIGFRGLPQGKVGTDDLR